MDTERQEQIRHLVEVIGLDHDEAFRLFIDDDLWILSPGTRLGSEGKEAVREWSKAAETLNPLVQVFQPIHGATWITLADARDRCDEAADRAQRRLEEARAKQ
jgi:hypothetical protein